MLRNLTGSWLVIFVGLALLPIWPRSFRPAGWLHPTSLLLCWTFGPLAMGLIASVVIEPVLLSYYLIGSLPPAIVLASLGLATIIRTQRTFVIAVAIVAVLCAASFIYASPPQRDDWRGAVAYLDEVLPADACVAVSVEWLRLPVDYYRRKPLPCRLTYEETMEVPAGHSVLLLVSPQDRQELVNRAVEALTPSMTLVDTQVFGSFTLVRFAPRL
jgi:hypothetical protein